MNAHTGFRVLVTAAAAGLSSLAEPQIAFPSDRQPTAPPPPPAVIEAAPGAAPEPRLRSAATLYSIGDPTPEEQLYIEMINRARANPVGEAELFTATTDPKILLNYDYFGVDLALMETQFSLIAPVPPLAPNAQLATAARRHSQDMLAKSFQGHTGSDNSTFDQRAREAGYTFSIVGENVYANADSVFHGHAGFEVDWGNGVGGMQTPPGHRNTIHDGSFREIGLGVVFGQNTPAAGSVGSQYRPVGPQLVTQEFGTRQGATPLITGVAYFDLNGNNSYDAGEGVGGVNVNVSGTATQAITARSGGYAVPVAGNGTYTVTFSGDGVAPFERQVTVSQAQNQKVDFVPAYTAPAVTGPATPVINNANTYLIAPVPSANEYQWRNFQLATPIIEGAESGSSAVTINQRGTYDVFESTTKKTGARSFHLATPAGGIREQSIVLNARYLVNANSTLRFQSRLGWATTTTFAIVQVSTDEGATWQEVYRQAGTTSSGESTFNARSVNLAPFAGSIVKLRFSFLPTGSSYTSTDSATGWFIDDIMIDGGFQIANEQITNVPENSFIFRPAVVTDFVLQGRARTGHDFLPWGPMLNVRSTQTSATPASFRVSGLSVTNGYATIDVELLSGPVPSWTLQSKRSLHVAWANVSANVQVLSATRFRFTTPIGAADGRQFYRVVGN